MRRLAIVAALLLVTAAAASAKPSVVSLTLDQAAPAFGDKVTFSFVTDEAYPIVEARCERNGILVYAAGHGEWDGAYDQGDSWTLGPTPSWSGGGAECVGILKYFKNGKVTVVYSTSFSVTAGGAA